MRILLITISILVMASVAATILIGARTFDGTVAADPYASGLRWDEERRQRDSSGWRVRTSFRAGRDGWSELVVQISDQQGRPLAGAVVAAALRRPDTNRYDRSLPLTEARAGEYSAPVVLELPGWWESRISVQHDGKGAEFPGRSYLPPEP